MTDFLFNDFDPVSSKVWKQKIQADLKGLNYNDALIWKNIEGIDIKPFYNADDYKGNECSTHQQTPWTIGETIVVFDAKTANKSALNALNKGVESIVFIISNDSISSKTLLKHIDSSKYNIYLIPLFLSESYYNTLPKNINLMVDVLGHLIKTGNCYSNLNSDLLFQKKITKITNCISISLTTYQNAGANIVQQLSYSFAQLNEYLNLFSDNELKTIKDAKIIFNVSVGSNYFFEIAKLKAIRLLWKTLSSAYNINPECHIIAQPTKRNKTLYDYNTNLLRTTTECMSAILGEADTICNLPYDAIYHKPNEFGTRIARNQLLILKHESYFNRVHNPASGSYYIEHLTHQFTENALNLFKSIEKQGGLIEQLKKGSIQRKIKEQALKEEKSFNAQKIILLGTNKHPNPLDKMKNNLDFYPFLKNNPRKTFIEPVLEKRLAENQEKKRLETEI